MTPAPSPLAPPGRLLLIQKGALGDVAITTALLDDLHRAFPTAAIDFGVGRAAAPLLERHPLIAERVIVDGAPAPLLALAIRRRRYDWVVDVQSSPRTSVLTGASGARVRVGWRQRLWGAAYSIPVERIKQQEYALRARRRLLEAAGVPILDSGPHIELSREERAAGERVLGEAGASAGRPRAGLLLGTTERARNWPLRHFATLAAMLRHASIAPVIFHAPGDDARIAELRAAVPLAIFAPPTDLRGFLGLLAASDVLVSGDTGPAHMADALGVRRVTIFGVSSPVAWVPSRPGVIALCSTNRPLLDLRERARLVGDREDYSADVMPDHVLGAIREALKH